MFHTASRLAVFTVTALGLALTATAEAPAAPPPGTKCEGGTAVINTNGQCVPNGSTCYLTDGLLFGWTNGDTGLCTPYNFSQSY
ncbi:hypothetical protein [Nocardia heshunensis]